MKQEAPPEREPTPEEILAFLQEIQRQGGDLEGAPPDLKSLLQNVNKQKGQPTDDVPTEDITPETGFVVKTHDDAGRKVFINMCGHPKVAAPGNWAGGNVPEEVAAALDNVDNLSNAQAETLRFPLSMGAAKQDTDKKGEACTTFDCCLNLDVIKQAAVYRPLKVFLIELALSWIEHKHKLALDRKFKLPKMKYKGEVVEVQRIRADRKPLVREIKEIEEDPVFPLVTKKLPPSKLVGAGSEDATAAASSPWSAASSGKGVGPAAGPGLQGGRISTGVAEVSTSGKEAIGAESVRAFRQRGTWQAHGRPVDAVSVEVEVPQAVVDQLQQAAASSSGQGSGLQAAVGSILLVEACGSRVYVGAAGSPELCIHLPFAVSGEGAQVELDLHAAPCALLRLRLPYMPVVQLVEAAHAQTPHSFGHMGLASNAALELEP